MLSASQFDNKIAWYENSASLPVTSVNFNVPGVPQQFILHNNYPNPFNPATTIAFQLPTATDVMVKIYNMLGREVKVLISKRFDAGTYSVLWDGLDSQGKQVASGVYLYRIETKGFSQTRKLLLLK